MNKEQQQQQQQKHSPMCGLRTLFVRKVIYKIIGSAHKLSQGVVYFCLAVPWPSSSHANCYKL